MITENLKISANWEVSEVSGSERFDLNDMNCQTIEEWHALSVEEKRNRIQQALYDLPDRVFINLSYFNELD